MAHLVAAFEGPVAYRRTVGAAGFTLRGRIGPASEEDAEIGFSGTAPPALPGSLDDVIVERLGDGRYRIVSATGTWEFGARAVHLHREIAPVFYRALPPRKVPWAKRCLLRLVLALAASRAGLSVLRALRR